MRQIDFPTPLPRDRPAEEHQGSAFAGGDVVSLLIAREQARHHSELTETREQISRLLPSPAAFLLTELDDDLAAVAIATVEAMATLRRSRQNTVETEAAGVDEITRAIGDHLAQVARSTRSIFAVHLTLEAQARSAPW